MYWVGPMCGAALGTSAYQAIFSEKKPSQYIERIGENDEKI